MTLRALRAMATIAKGTQYGTVRTMGDWHHHLAPLRGTVPAADDGDHRVHRTAVNATAFGLLYAFRGGEFKYAFGLDLHP